MFVCTALFLQFAVEFGLFGSYKSKIKKIQSLLFTHPKTSLQYMYISKQNFILLSKELMVFLVRKLSTAFSDYCFVVGSNVNMNHCITSICGHGT